MLTIAKRKSEKSTLASYSILYSSFMLQSPMAKPSWELDARGIWKMLKAEDRS